MIQFLIKWIDNRIKEVVDREIWDVKKILKDGHILSCPIVSCDGCGVLTTKDIATVKEVKMTMPHFIMVKRYCRRCVKNPLYPFDKELLKK